ncbi:MAG: hypothetical protein U0441_19750 [Polyangiaceae bacterium]
MALMVEARPRLDDGGEAQQLLASVIAARGQDDVRRAAADALNFLLKQLEELRVRANGYPRNPISGDVWVNGRALTEVCDALADEFSRRGLAHEEELASRIATGMALQIMGHYPEEIFPRVLRNSRSRERIGEVDEAIGGYEAIVADFDVLGLVSLLEDDEPPDESGRVILTSLYEAVSRLSELRPERAATLEDLKANLLARQSKYVD